jgi:hypothetical protein
MGAQIIYIVETFRRNVSNKNPIYAHNTDARWAGRDKCGQCPPDNSIASTPKRLRAA